MFYYDIDSNVPNVLISKVCVGVDDVGVDGACIPKNSDHVLMDSRMEGCLPACGVQKGLRTGTRE